MIKFYKLVLISLLICFGIMGISFANAADVTAQDLDVSEPTLLPNSPFYFFKEWSRGIQSFFTFGQLKKTELEQKFANERLVELQKMVEEGKISSDILQKATDKFQKAMEKIRERADKIEDDAANNENVNKFLEKFTNQQVLHEKILQKLEEQVPADVLQKIKDAREQHLEKFQGVMQKLEGNKKNETSKKTCTKNSDCPTIYCIKAPCPKNICVNGVCKQLEIREACTMEAKQCPNGSYVGRTGPNCEFAQCPSETEPTALECKERNGVWGKIGLSLKEQCNLRTSDSGKTCTSSTQCEGDCISDILKSSANPISGKCSEFKIVVGCRFYFDNGVPQKICKD